MNYRALLLASAVLPLAFGPAAAFGPRDLPANGAVRLVQDSGTSVDRATAQTQYEDARRAVQEARRALRRARQGGGDVTPQSAALARAVEELRLARGAFVSAMRGDAPQNPVEQQAIQEEQGAQARAAAGVLPTGDPASAEAEAELELGLTKEAAGAAEAAPDLGAVGGAETAPAGEAPVVADQAAGEPLSPRERRRLAREQAAAADAGQAAPPIVTEPPIVSEEQAAGPAPLEVPAAPDQVAGEPPPELDNQPAGEELTPRERRRLAREQAAAAEAGQASPPAVPADQQAIAPAPLEAPAAPEVIVESPPAVQAPVAAQDPVVVTPPPATPAIEEELTPRERRRLAREQAAAAEAAQATPPAVAPETQAAAPTPPAATQEPVIVTPPPATPAVEAELTPRERRRLAREQAAAAEAAQATPAPVAPETQVTAPTPPATTATQTPVIVTPPPATPAAEAELTPRERRRLAREQAAATEAGQATPAPGVTVNNTIQNNNQVTQDQQSTQQQTAAQQQAAVQQQAPVPPAQPTAPAVAVQDQPAAQRRGAEAGEEVSADELDERRRARREARERRAREEGRGDVTINNIIQNENQATQQQANTQQQAATQQQATQQQQIAPDAALTAEERRQRRRDRARLEEEGAADRDDAPSLRDRLRQTRGELRDTRRRLRDVQLRADDEVLRREEDRVIVRREGQIIILREENEDRFGEEVQVEELPNGATRTTVLRPGGVRIVTIRNAEGEIVRRSRILADNRETVLIGAGEAPQRQETRVDVQVDLPPLVVNIPREEYVVEMEQATEAEVQTALAAPPVEKVERVYTLEEVRQNERVRNKVRRVDLDTITFEFGSATISEDQLITLEKVGIALEDIVFERPDEVFLIEGHTDAVGSNVANLELSDRRAEAVAIALAQNFDIPPENLVTQGYGEEDLKVPTQAPERENRRVTLRRITALVNAEAHRQ